MTRKPRKGDFWGVEIKKISLRCIPRTYLEACALEPRLRNRSVFILDPPSKFFIIILHRQITLCFDCKLTLDGLLSCSKKGTSLTFVTRDDWRQAHKLINIMVEANQVTDIFSRHR